MSIFAFNSLFDSHCLHYNIGDRSKC